MDATKLDIWAKLLLDTGKRNNLINFKDTASSTVEVISPDFSTLAQYVGQCSNFQVYDPKLEDDEENFDVQGNKNEEVIKKRQISKSEYLSAYEKRLRSQQILLYNSDNDPVKALKNIGKKAKAAIEETGVNIAFLAFGFIHWTEREDSETEMRAPILLVPISIENKSAIDPYYIRIMEDDTIVNPTFSFKLQTDYGIKLPEYNEDTGIEYFFQQIEAIISKLKWTISRECKIGIFSFLKINMYKDLKENAEKIIQNAGIRALLGEIDEQPNYGDMGGVDGNRKNTYDLLELHNVVDADSSQAEAIEFTKRGKSFVLQGPPGTGKSQTITNIIAECLYDGKKVLFVSEKLAALNVVYDKLRKVGLEEFCLELHSYKANKKEVIEELCRTLKSQKSGLSGKAEEELRSKKNLQQKLDNYAIELHKARTPINKTLYQIYNELSACRTAPTVDFVIANIKNKGGEYIEQVETALIRYMEYTKSVGTDFRANIWYGYNNSDYSYQTVMQLRSDLQSVVDSCGKLITLSENLKTQYELSADNLQHSVILRDFFNFMETSKFITPALLNTHTIAKILEIAPEMQKLAKEIIDKKTTLDQLFNFDIYKLDAQNYYEKLRKEYWGVFSRLFNSEYKRIIHDIRICKKNSKKLKYKIALDAMNNLRMYREKQQVFNNTEESIQSYFGSAYNGVNTNFDLLISELNTLSDILSNAYHAGISFENLEKIESNRFIAEQSAFVQIAKEYNDIFAKYWEGIQSATANFNPDEYDIQSAQLQNLMEKCQGCIDNIEQIDNWCGFLNFLKKLESLELKDFVLYSIENGITPDKLVSTFKKTFYMQWVDTILHDSIALMELPRIPHDEAVKLFREKDVLNFDINKAKIKAELSAKRPNLDMVAQGSSVAILLREGEKKRNQKSIRLLLSEIGELVQTLKPCFLMSPLSVSTFLNSDIEFDVIVFDEASQIFPQDAVGAFYRGKQHIVVGDSKQMPPTNFFNSVADLENNDEDNDAADFESILDLCSASFAQRRLKWHYRSRFEQLISFSNKNFYENDLITFPSAKVDKQGIGVDFFYVDGTFDRKSKTNRAEAERIVDLVFENIEKYPERSLGVVAFSMAQQGLIDNLIWKRRQQDPSKEPFFRSDKAEPFFVKNLEAVQGDERDTIIFSIAYAKDSQGRLLLNFGPINRAGGERRLNVAVTRAKFNVQVVASIHYTDIDLSRTNSVGARLLREYLDYAENGAIALDRALNVNPYEQFDSEFESEVCDFLRENGFAVDTQVGCSSFKIDLALKKPNSSDYLLAIECDGASYHSSRTARDRDRLRQDILEGMGWRFYRIWSTDWFRNKPVEQERLLKIAKEAVENAPLKIEDFVETTSFEEAHIENAFAFPKYVMADEIAISRQYGGDIFNVTRAILEVEAPLAEEWLLKRIVYLFENRRRVTNVVRDYFDRLMQNCNAQGIIRRNGFLYIQGKEIPMLRVPVDSYTLREIKYIDAQELALGLKELLKQNVKAEKLGLFRLLAQQLGFSHVGDTILTHMENALSLISHDIETNAGMISLKNY